MMTRFFRRFVLRAAAIAALGMILVLLVGSPVSAQTHPVSSTPQQARRAPVPSCGGSIQVTLVSRTIVATTVKVVAVDMGRWIPTGESYALIYVSANQTTHGPYNASRYGGANFKVTFPVKAYSIYVSVDNEANTVTLCQKTVSV